MFSICSLNVNGLKAAIGHGLVNVLNHLSTDCICLQETKVQPGDEPLVLPGYYSYWSCSVVRKGYSGTAMFTKIKPKQVTYGIGCQEFDDEGRSITAEFDRFYVVNVYVPTSGEGLYRLDYRQRWDAQLRKYLASLQSIKPVIVCGDFNVVKTPLDLFLGSNVLRCAGVTEEERGGFQLLENQGFIDVWRHLHPNEVGYSWWPYAMNAKRFNLGWRLDYFLCSNSLMTDVSRCEMFSQFTVSDHCPILLTLNRGAKIYFN